MKPALLHLAAMVAAAFAAVAFSRSAGIAAAHALVAFQADRLYLGACWALAGAATAAAAFIAIAVTVSLAVAATERDWMGRRARAGTRCRNHVDEDFS